MISYYRNTALELNAAAPVFSDCREDTAGCSPAIRLEPAVKPDRTVMPATPVMPGPEAVRALLILTAESAFDLQEGKPNSLFPAQLGEQSENLAQALATLPEAFQGPDCGLMHRRARRAVDVLNETIRREVLNNIDENTKMGELKARLLAVKVIAAEAGRALALLKVRDARLQ